MGRCGIGLAALLLCVLPLIPVAAPAAETELNLEQALERFYAYNYDIIISRYDIDKSHADFITAKLRPNPNFTFDAIGLKPGSDVLRSTDNTQITARIDQLIEVAGKRGLRTQSASQTVEAAKLTHDDVIRNLLIGFYTLFFNLNRDRLDLDAAQDEIKRFDRTLLIAQKKHDAGFLNDIDFVKLKLTRIDLETNLSNMQNQFNTDLDQFSALLGIDKPLKSVAMQVDETYTEYSEDDLVSKAYQCRYDLLSLQKQLGSAKTDFSLARANRIPNVTVGVEYDSFGTKFEPTVGAGFSVNIPIFDRNQGNIERKEAEYKQIEVQIVKTRRQIVSDVRDALYNYISSSEIFTSYKKKKSDMNYLIHNSEKAFALGGITVLDLIDTERTYFNYLKEYNKALTKLNLNNELIKLYTGEMK